MVAGQIGQPTRETTFRLFDRAYVLTLSLSLSLSFAHSPLFTPRRLSTISHGYIRSLHLQTIPSPFPTLISVKPFDSPRSPLRPPFEPLEPAVMSRGKIFALSDVAKHTSRTSLWISYKGRVYDITHFIDDHPGGDDIVLKYAGTDVGPVMADETEHVHSRSAYEMLTEYQIGELGGDERIVSEGEYNFSPCSLCPSGVALHYTCG